MKRALVLAALLSSQALAESRSVSSMQLINTLHSLFPQPQIQGSSNTGSPRVMERGG